jgi:hypothetical protein
MAGPPQSNIFISHASSNLEEALSLKSQLSNLGYTTWMAVEDIEAGVNFAEEISKSIKASDAVVVLLSPESIASPHVKREVNLTIDNQKYLIPVLLGNEKDFFATLPEDWRYWLSVVQILKFANSDLTSREIAGIVSKRKDLTRIVSNSKRKKGIFASKLRFALVAFSTVFTLILMTSVIAEFGNDELSEGSVDSEASSALPTKVIVAKESMLTIDSSSELPSFPTAIVDYELQEIINSADSWQLRLYGVDWQTPDFFEFTMINGCNQLFWILRWRAESPDSIIKSAHGFIDVDINYENKASVFEDDVAQGNAGYISGFACEAPFLISADAPTNFLEDIDYELQIWRYKRGI